MPTGNDNNRMSQPAATLASGSPSAIVGVLTKIGQAVREEDQRKFAREKAETFAKRVLLSKATDREEEI